MYAKDVSMHKQIIFANKKKEPHRLHYECTIPAVLTVLHRITLKGLSRQILWVPFWVCMDRSGQEREPLLAFNFSVTPLIFGCHFKVLKHLI